MSTIEQRLSKALSAETSAFLGREVSTQHDDRERDNSIYVHGVSAIAPLGDGRTFRAKSRCSPRPLPTNGTPEKHTCGPLESLRCSTVRP